MSVKGKWEPYSQVLGGGERKYIAGRVIDASQPLHGGNIEYFGRYTPHEEAVVGLCDLLNEEEAEEDGEDANV